MPKLSESKAASLSSRPWVVSIAPRPALRSTSRVAALLVLVALATLGCDALQSKTESVAKPACACAQRCCEELNQATAYRELADLAKQTQWPNHCPSWNARSENECRSFLDAADTHRAALEKEHPVYDSVLCDCK